MVYFIQPNNSGRKLISSLVSGVGDTAITFSSIPNSYKNLQIEFSGANTYNSTTLTYALRLEFNGDTNTANYDHSTFANYGGGLTFGSGGGCSLIASGGTPTIPFGNSTIDIMNYHDDQQKVGLCRGWAAQINVGICHCIGSTRWIVLNTPITDITIKSQNSEVLMTSSKAWLYGIN